MASSSFTLPPPPLPLSPKLHTGSNHLNVIFRSHSFSNLPRLQSSRRISHFSQDNDDLVDDPDPRNWTRNRSVVAREYGNDEDENDEDDEDQSLDLLVRFIQNVYKRSWKAMRSVLPISISTKLVFMLGGD